MDSLESSRILKDNPFKVSDFTGLLQTFARPSSASESATSSSPLASSWTAVNDFIKRTLGSTVSAAVGVGLVATALVAGVSLMTFKSAKEQVNQVESENSRLISEIDRLTKENDLLQEGSERATQLNTEVQALLQAMQAADLPPEQMQGQLQLLLENLLEMVRRQSAQLQARNDELLAQTRMLREENLCKLCFEYPVVRSFNPCGHGTCVKCASRLQHKPCPFCRKDVESVIPRF